MTTGPNRARRASTAVRAAEELLAREARTLMVKAIKLALAGDAPTLRLLLDRILPERKTAAVPIRLGDTSTSEGVSTALDRIIAEAAAGRLTPTEAQALATVVDSKRRAIDLVDLEDRIARLEKRALR